jgi:hypothetical protein
MCFPHRSTLLGDYFFLTTAAPTPTSTYERSRTVHPQNEQGHLVDPVLDDEVPHETVVLSIGTRGDGSQEVAVPQLTL